MKLGISYAGRENYYGPFIVSIVLYDNNLFRKTHIDFKSDDETIFKLSNTKLDFFHLYKIRPEDLKEKDLKLAHLRTIIECLNLVKDFWKYDIEIDYDNQDYFKLMFDKLLPKNLKKLNLNLKRFKLCDDSKPIYLARSYARYLLDKEIKDIKMIYPNIENEGFINENKDCPYLRNWVKE